LNKLKEKYKNLNSALPLDIVAPCFRIDENCLNRILSIKSDPRVDHRFIIIVDRNIKDIPQEKIDYLKNLEKKEKNLFLLWIINIKSQNEQATNPQKRKNNGF